MADLPWQLDGKWRWMDSAHGPYLVLDASESGRPVLLGHNGSGERLQTARRLDDGGHVLTDLVTDHPVARCIRASPALLRLVMEWIRNCPECGGRGKVPMDHRPAEPCPACEAEREILRDYALEVFL